MIPSPTPSSIWVERYEALRHHVLKAGPVLDLQPLGLVLWLDQGMAGWMRRWAEAVELASSPAVAPSAPPRPIGSLWQQQLTLLLAQITVERLYPNLN
jgi:hypothetical protein